MCIKKEFIAYIPTTCGSTQMNLRMISNPRSTGSREVLAAKCECTHLLVGRMFPDTFYILRIDLFCWSYLLMLCVSYTCMVIGSKHSFFVSYMCMVIDWVEAYTFILSLLFAKLWLRLCERCFLSSE